LDASIIGPFFGVLFAFAINYLYSGYNNSQEKIFWLTLLKQELRESTLGLEEMITRNGSLMFSLHDDMWNSFTYSGSIRFFPPNEAYILSQIYREIGDFNKNREIASKDLIETSRFLDEIAKSVDKVKDLEVHIKSQKLRYEITKKTFLMYASKLLYKLKELESQKWFNDKRIESKEDTSLRFWLEKP